MDTDQRPTADMTWMSRGSCLGEDPDLWFADIRSKEAAKAALICSGCPVQALCATYAASEGMEGIWGGTAFFPAVCGRSRPPVVLIPGVPRRRGRKSLLDTGKCKRNHRILSEDDVVLRITKGRPFYRCRYCMQLEGRNR